MFCSAYISAQISPGDLADAHMHLEGMGNCTQCHDLGNKVPNQKCLSCHDEIESLIAQNRGYHSYYEVKEKNCIACHSDHHGRKFEMMRLDEDNFDHDLTGYVLEGEHGRIDCKSCHVSENIKDVDIKFRTGTYLGLEPECLSCHNDFHDGGLGNDCIKCHNFEAFSPVPDFDHDQTDYSLKGAHIEVTCVECHPIEVRNAKEYKKFSGLSFNDCVDCHKNPHSSNWNSKCSSCHVETGFEKFIGQSRFNHKRTDFELKGKHKTTNCFECHDSKISPDLLFSDLKGINENECIQCHQDVHDGKFGNDCVQCHNEESFYSVKLDKNFNHDLTDYPLVGLHQSVDCKSCHEGSFTNAIDFDQCKNCHDDYHEGEFSTRVDWDCAECHSIEEKFSYTSYGFEEHEKSQFPLEGAHLATPCFECHVSEGHWSFKNIGNKCVDCHEDIHQDFISEKYYPNQDCTKCHDTESWASVNFDHSLTDWELAGMHVKVNCSDCHMQDETADKKGIQVFKNLNQDCISCHDNPHGDQFEEDGKTDCRSCHNTEHWFPDNFDHDKSDFPLEGKHSEIECSACHKSIIDEFGIEQTEFKIQKFECIDCHL